MYVISSNQSFPEEILKELEKAQGERWVKKRWNNGFLWALGENEMYPVIGGIPIFVFIAPSGHVLLAKKREMPL